MRGVYGGPNLTDDRFHNTGVGWSAGGASDNGRFVVTGVEADRAALRRRRSATSRTAPYMHDGSLATLEAVVDFYARGGNRNPNLDQRMRPEQFRPRKTRTHRVPQDADWTGNRRYTGSLRRTAVFTSSD